MKTLIFVFINLIFAGQSFASHEKEKIIMCSKKNIPGAQTWINQQYYNTYDKFKHCAVSCYLDLRCPRAQVGLVGIAKEIRDAMGYGNAEWADLRANFYGMKLVRKKLAKNDDDCARHCDEKFPAR